MLSTPLLPYFGLEQPNMPRDHRRLVPVLPLPPLIGRNRDHGAQANLQLLVIAELRRLARQLVEHGGALLGPDRWSAMARRAGLPDSLLPRVLDRWTSDDDAFLVAVARRRYTLADRRAREFVEAGGRGELADAEGGRKSRKHKQR